MKKHLANIITSSRVVIAFGMFFLNDISGLFLWLYIFCGFTDFIDGIVARKTNSSSELGATLDTIGDVLMYLSLTKNLIMQDLVPGWILIWVVCGAVLFGLCGFVSLKRFKRYYLPHTYLGKLFGASVFVLPVMMQFMDHRIWMATICSIATIHIFKLFYVQSKSSEARPFVASVFDVK